jgi:dipeptidyl aminopeptidase/acylaminoacyl peptidase
MKPIEFTARDGMKLYGYLTTPAGVEPKSLPMVEFVHGGPWGRDEWGYNRYAQWLSNRGYAVLQINFRGSTGYGKKYVNAGDRQWAGTMHTDLLDGKDWVVKQGIAEPAKVCIMGGSYGGYATLAGVTFSPDAFACGVDIVGPSNLNTLLKTIPPYWSTLVATFHKRMGDSEQILKQQSPLFKADQIKAPLLIGQGANDPRVNKAESDQIVAAMRKNNKPVQYYVFPDEGHGFARPTNNMAFNAATEEFLAKYLGGRFEPATPDESKLLASIKQ